MANQYDWMWVYDLPIHALIRMAAELGLAQEGGTAEAVIERAQGLNDDRASKLQGYYVEARANTAYPINPNPPPLGSQNVGTAGNSMTPRVPSASTMKIAAQYEADRRKWLKTRSAEEQAGFNAPSTGDPGAIPVLGYNKRTVNNSPSPLGAPKMAVAFGSTADQTLTPEIETSLREMIRKIRRR